MEFIEEYYIWFIAGGIILFMTLIGYIADKSNYIEKQKNKNKEKKNSLIEQKQKHITKKGEEFIKNIGDGKNLVLEESNINYKIDLLDEDTLKKEEIDRTPIEENNNLNVGINSYIEKETPVSSISMGVGDKDIETPLENGVLNLDAYDNEEENEEELWKF